MALKCLKVIIKDEFISIDEATNRILNVLNKYRELRPQHEYIAQVVNPYEKSDFFILDDTLKNQLNLDSNYIETRINTKAIEARIQELKTKLQELDLKLDSEIVTLNDEILKKASIENLTSIQDGLDIYALKSELNSLATKDELNTKANISDLENLATKEQLSTKADISTLESYTKKTEFTAISEALNAIQDNLDTYALKSEINIDENALNEAINNNSNIQELEAKVNDLTTNLQRIRTQKGEKGEKGNKGEKGDKGDKGEQGIQGIKGDKGDKGDKGERGEQGLKGDKGDKGDKGEQGERGERGERGEQGIQGLKGEKGEKGDKGDPGDTPTLKTINGQSLIGNGDITIQTNTSSLETTLADLQTKMGKFLRVFSEAELDELARWKRADTSRWSNVFGGSSVGVGDVIRFNNAKSAFLAPENVRGIKFKLRARNNPGGYILWLLTSANRSNQSDIRALTMDMRTSYLDTYTNWIKPREGHNRYDGTHGATADNIKDVFNCHNVEIKVLIENGKLKCSNALGYSFEVNVFGGSGFINRLGLGSQANFSDTAEAYDIKILTN